MSVRWTLKLFERQCWANFWEMGWSAYGLSWVHRYHLEWNWTHTHTHTHTPHRYIHACAPNHAHMCAHMRAFCNILCTHAHTQNTHTHTHTQSVQTHTHTHTQSVQIRVGSIGGRRVELSWTSHNHRRKDKCDTYSTAEVWEKVGFETAFDKQNSCTASNICMLCKHSLCYCLTTLKQGAEVWAKCRVRQRSADSETYWCSSPHFLYTSTASWSHWELSTAKVVSLLILKGTLASFARGVCYLYTYVGQV